MVFYRVFMLRRVFFRFFPSAFLLLVVALLTLPVLAVVLSWLEFDSEARSILTQMLQTVLPDYTWTSLLLCLLVGAGRGRRRHGHGQRGDAVRVSGPPRL